MPFNISATSGRVLASLKNDAFPAPLEKEKESMLRV
jgi:hypothetical protein